MHKTVSRLCYMFILSTVSADANQTISAISHGTSTTYVNASGIAGEKKSVCYSSIKLERLNVSIDANVMQIN